MNRVKSSTNAQSKKFLQSEPPAKKENKTLKRERIPTNPVNGFSFSTRSSGSSSSCSDASGSGSNSGEPSNHRFLLSHSFSSSSSSSSSLGVFPNRSVKPVAKTPKSAPVVSKPLIRKKPRFMEETKLKSTVNEKLDRSGKRLTGKITVKPEKVSVLMKKQSSVSREVKLKDRQTTIRVDDSIAQITTPVSKLGKESDLIYRSNGEATDDGYRERTPPVQASVSPEIQCGSSMSFSTSAQSQACYAAGHLLSGVSDKRKCKPKGILTVGENGSELGKAKIEEDFDDVSVMPLPADASVHWLLSPCDEEKEKSDDGLSQFQQIVECVSNEMTPSPLSDRSTSSDLCNISSGKSLSPMSIGKETMRRTSSSLSPAELSRFRRFMHLSSCEGVRATPTCEHLKKDKPSPLSVDTLGSENVIQTPESNSSFDNYLGLLNSEADIQKVGSDMESLTMSLESASLSPRSHASPREPSSSSFNFDSFAPSSDSVDFSQFQRALVDRSPSHSHVTLEKDSRTHVRVSYREEINSHMPEMKPQQITDTELDTRNHKESVESPGKGRGLLPCSAAESINTDGGGLICSEDSNWMACYKN